MGVEVSVKLKCGQCGKKIPVKGQIIRGRALKHGKRRPDDITVEDVLIVDYPVKPEYAFDIKIEIGKGGFIEELEDSESKEGGRKICCSPKCAHKALATLLPKMWRMKAKDENGA
jgi:hypothetical protein